MVAFIRPIISSRVLHNLENLSHTLAQRNTIAQQDKQMSSLFYHIMDHSLSKFNTTFLHSTNHSAVPGGTFTGVISTKISKKIMQDGKQNPLQLMATRFLMMMIQTSVCGAVWLRGQYTRVVYHLNKSMTKRLRRN